MSGLPGIALLVILTQAFRARMGSSVRVEMQPDSPVDATLGPALCVFVERASAHPSDVSMILGDSQIVLRIELFAPVDAGSASSPGSAALKGSTALFFMWRECVAALAPDASPWSALWEAFRLSIVAEMYAPPLFETEKGVKVAAHVYSLTVDALSDPPFGDPPQAWADLLAQMRADGGELTGFADILEASIRGGGLGAFEALAATLGLSGATMASIGLGSAPDAIPAQVGTDSGAVDEEVTASADPSAPDVQVGP